MAKVEIGRDNKNKPTIIDYDDTFSLRDFTNQNLKSQKMNGLIIYGSCFSQEIIDNDIFPDGMTGTSFYNCNLDNIFIPPGNTVIGGSQKRFKPENDIRDWEVDNLNQPVKVVSEEAWILLKFSVDKNDIPVQKLDSINAIVKVP